MTLLAKTAEKTAAQTAYLSTDFALRKSAFKTLTGKQLGVKLTRLGEGAGELDVYFDPAIPVEEEIIATPPLRPSRLCGGQVWSSLRAGCLLEDSWR